MSYFSKIVNSLVKFIEPDQVSQTSKETSSVTTEENGISSTVNIDEFRQNIVESLSSYLNSRKFEKSVIFVTLLFEIESEKNSINSPDQLAYIIQQLKLQSGLDVTLIVASATIEQWRDEKKFPKLLPTVALDFTQNVTAETHNICASLIPLEEYADRFARHSFELNTSKLSATHQFFLIGRGEHTKTRTGAPRMNDIVISDGVNQVSRSQARIGFDQGLNVFFLKADDGGVNCGTRVFHRDSSDWFVLSSTQARVNLIDEDVIELGGENGVQLLFKL